MTAFATPRLRDHVDAAPSAGRVGESLASFRRSLRECGRAFKVSGRMPHRGGIDYTALLMLGRD